MQAKHYPIYIHLEQSKRNFKGRATGLLIIRLVSISLFTLVRRTVQPIDQPGEYRVTRGTVFDGVNAGSTFRHRILIKSSPCLCSIEYYVKARSCEINFLGNIERRALKTVSIVAIRFGAPCRRYILLIILYGRLYKFQNFLYSVIKQFRDKRLNCQKYTQIFKKKKRTSAFFKHSHYFVSEGLFTIN